MSDICIQRLIIDNVFYSTFTNVFLFLSLYTCLTFFKFFFERFYIYALHVTRANKEL